MANSVAEIQRWKPRHEIMCLMHVAGRPNTEIADHVGVNQERVSIVLNSQRGKARIEALRKQIIDGAAQSIEDTLTILGPQAVKNIATTIGAEIPASAGRAKAHQDKVSFELLSRIGYGRTDRTGGGEGGIKLDRDIQERLADALEQSAEATKIYDAEWAEVVEAKETVGARTHSD